MPIRRGRILVRGSWTPKIWRVISMQLLRDGATTGTDKVLRVYDSPDTLKLITQFSCPQGARSLPQRLDPAVFNGSYFVIGFDRNTGDPLVRGALQDFVESADLTFNIFAGNGSEGGTPGAVDVVVRVDGVPAGRRAVAVELQGDGQWRIAGSTRTDAGRMELTVTGGQVYVMAVDDFGVAFQGSLAVLVGDLVRPSVHVGWLYRVTEAGTLPASEPEWWPMEGDNAPRQLGTARAIAVRYYRPLAHGPVTVEVT